MKYLLLKKEMTNLMTEEVAADGFLHKRRFLTWEDYTKKMLTCGILIIGEVSTGLFVITKGNEARGFILTYRIFGNVAQ